MFLPAYIFLALVVFAHVEWKAVAYFGYGSKGRNLKLSIGQDVSRLNFKGLGFTDFRGGWSARVSVVIRFKRFTGEINGSTKDHKTPTTLESTYGLSKFNII